MQAPLFHRRQQNIDWLTDSSRLIVCHLALLLFIVFAGCDLKQQSVLKGSDPNSVSSGLENMPLLMLETSSGPIRFFVELARSNPERAKGLMHRPSLEPNRGMLFFFDYDAKHAFWMKNTLIPLDIIFIDKNWRVVHVEENMVPESLVSRASSQPCRYVLEINAGLAKKYRIEVGNLAQFVEGK